MEQLLSEPPLELAKRLGVSDEHARHIRGTVQRAAAPAPVCVYDLVEGGSGALVPGTPREDEIEAFGEEEAAPYVSFLPSGSSVLDACLGGGYARGMISELIGESSSGKTQLLLHTAVYNALALGTPASVVRGGEGEGVALISTQGRSAARHMVHRMVQMAHEMLHEGYVQLDIPPDTLPALVEQGVSIMLRNVSIACAFTFESAQHVLCYTLPGLVARRRAQGVACIQLVVVDSIPPLLQEDSLEADPMPGGSAAHSIRAARLHALSEWLKRLAAAPRACEAIAVLVANHVSDAFDHDKAMVRHAYAQGELPRWNAPSRRIVDPAHLLPLPYAAQAAHFSGLLASVPHDGALPQDADLKTAQLGLVWANCVNARYLVAHAADDARRFAVVFSPTAPSGEVRFTITPRGLYTYAS